MQKFLGRCFDILLYIFGIAICIILIPVLLPLSIIFTILLICMLGYELYIDFKDKRDKRK
jgi:hypothetical protein